MLDPNALKSVVALTQKLSSDGLILAPVANTPLALLVHELSIAGIDPEKATYDGAISAIVDCSRDERHNEVRKTYLNGAVSAVRSTLSFTRTEVMPHIRRVLQSYSDMMDSYQSGRPPIEFDIKYVPEIYTSHIGRDLIDRWNDVPTANSPGAINLGSYEPDEILQLVQVTNDQDFNTDMAELLSANGGEGLKQIIEVVGGVRNVTQLDDVYSLPASIVLQAISQPKEGVPGTLSNYNANRAVMSNVAGKAAMAVLARLGTSIRDTNIYSSLIIRPGEKVVLCGEVYRDLLEKGLTVEALMGNEILGRPHRGQALLVPENIERMMAAYEKDRLVRQQAAAQDRKANSRKAIMNSLRADLDAVVEQGKMVIEGDDKERAWSRLRTVVDQVLSSEWRDAEPIYLIATCICVTWYAHTDAARFIDIMLDIEKQNPGMAETQFDFLATLRYISLWVASQISAERAA